MTRRAGTICLEPGCPHKAHHRGRCPAHARQAEERRGSREQRGYGRAYRDARDAALRGATHCATCGCPFTIDNPATGGHARAQRDGGTLEDGIRPECARCNYGWRRTGR